MPRRFEAFSLAEAKTCTEYLQSPDIGMLLNTLCWLRQPRIQKKDVLIRGDQNLLLERYLSRPLALWGVAVRPNALLVLAGYKALTESNAGVSLPCLAFLLLASPYRHLPRLSYTAISNTASRDCCYCFSFPCDSNSSPRHSAHSSRLGQICISRLETSLLSLVSSWRSLAQPSCRGKSFDVVSRETWMTTVRSLSPPPPPYFKKDKKKEKIGMEKKRLLWNEFS